MTVATDEIYEKYLQKAITEINALGDEVAQAASGTRVPVVGSGHPLADVFLLKYAPQASELQEGVAFYGRSGNALLKSLQRLRVDAMAIYGTNCLKFADGDEEESRPFLLRELHIVQPKLVVAMGEQARRVPQLREVPAGPRAQHDRRRAADVHADDRRARDAGHRPIPRRAAGQDAFWNAFKLLGDWWASPTSLLKPSSRRVAAFVSPLRRVSCSRGSSWRRTCRASGSGRRSLIVSVAVMPATLLLVLLALPLWSQRRLLVPATITFALLALVFSLLDWGLPANFAKLWAAVFAGWAFLLLFEQLSWVVLVALVIPARRCDLRLARSDEGDHRATTSRCTRRSRSRFSSPAAAPRTSGRRTSSSTRSSSPRPRAGTSASSGRGSR